MIESINSSSQEIVYSYPQTIVEEDISELLHSIESANLDEFTKLLKNFDLNRVYNHEKLPDPQLLSKFLLLRFLGLIEGDHHFPNAEKFIEIVLATKPDLTFDLVAGYSFANFLKDQSEILAEEIIDLRSASENTIYPIPTTDLLQYCEEQLRLIELIITSVS
jgi:hypothetical protein